MAIMPQSKDLQKEKRTRRPHIKTKSGCVTCKKRRVKCGEETPSCARCLHIGLRCDGYEKPKEDPRRRNRRIETGTSIPPNSALSVMISTCVSSSTSCSTATQTHLPVDQALFSFPSAPRFQNPQEYRFHQLFCSKVAGELSGFFPSDVWCHCVLQAAEAEPFIFDAVLAVGALHNIVTDAPDLKNAEAHRQYKDKHNFALEKYHDSLRSMRKALIEGRVEARIALIACLLTVCFENLYGTRGIAIFNMLSGVKLAKQLAHQKPAGALPGVKSTGPTAASIEKELVDMFTRLDITSMIFIDRRPADEHRIMKDSLDQAIESLPREYSALDEAVRDGEMIMAHCWHFIKIIQEIGQEFPSIFDCIAKANKGYWLSRSIRYGWNPWTDSDDPVPTSWLEESERCVGEIEQWFTAFSPLVRKFESSAEKYSMQLRRATLASLQAKFTLVSVRGAIYRREEEWDTHISDFREIVILSETLLASQPKRFYASFESDTLVILAYLICKCRDGAIRRRALRLIDDYPRREAAWDSKYCSKIGHWIMNVEEGGRGPLKSSEITEKQRLRSFSIDYDSVEGSIRTWACQKTTDGQTVNHNLLWN